MTRILITGGTGLIGKHLTKKLREKNYEVLILTRSPKNENEFQWNINEKYIDEKVFKNLDYIIHLAGAGIADKRWTDKRKQEIIKSRVHSTNLLLQKVKEHQVNLKGFIAASAIGFYGAKTTDKIFEETDFKKRIAGLKALSSFIQEEEKLINKSKKFFKIVDVLVK